MELECVQCHGIVRGGCAGRQPRRPKQARCERRTRQKKVVVGATGVQQMMCVVWCFNHKLKPANRLIYHRLHYQRKFSIHINNDTVHHLQIFAPKSPCLIRNLILKTRNIQYMSKDSSLIKKAHLWHWPCEPFWTCTLTMSETWWNNPGQNNHQVLHKLSRSSASVIKAKCGTYQIKMYFWINFSLLYANIIYNNNKKTNI